MKEMASEEVIRFVKVPTRTPCYASGLDTPSMLSEILIWNMTLAVQSASLPRALLLTRCLAFIHQYLL